MKKASVIGLLITMLIAALYFTLTVFTNPKKLSQWLKIKKKEMKNYAS